MSENQLPQETLDFLQDYSVDDLKKALTGAKAELARERDLLHCAPKPLEDADKRLLGTQRKDLSTVDLTQWRIAFWERVTNRLLTWYEAKSGQATGSERPRGSSLG